VFESVGVSKGIGKLPFGAGAYLTNYSPASVATTYDSAEGAVKDIKAGAASPMFLPDAFFMWARDQAASFAEAVWLEQLLDSQ